MDTAQNEAKKYLNSMKEALKIEKKNITNARIIETVSVLNLLRSTHSHG
jgi:hypothetical protein